MGWVMAPARQLRGHQFGNAVLSRLPIAQHLEHDLSWKTCEARRMQRVDIAGARLHAAPLQRAPRHRDPRAAASGASGWRRSSATGTSPGPKLVLGDFNEWMRGLATTLLSEKLQQRRPARFSAAQADAAHLPGLFPVLHLDHIYYAGQVEIVGVELPRTRLSLVASDHLPLVADIRLG